MSFPSAHHEAVSRRYQHLLRQENLSSEQEAELETLRTQLSHYKDLRLRDDLLERIRLDESEQPRLKAELAELDWWLRFKVSDLL